MSAPPVAREVGARIHEEKHFRAADLVTLWGVSKDTIVRLFKNEPGVLCISRGKRNIFSIPDSVAARVHARFRQQGLSHDVTETVTTFRSPRRIIHFGGANRRMTKQARNILHGDAVTQTPDSKRVA